MNEPVFKAPLPPSGLGEQLPPERTEEPHHEENDPVSKVDVKQKVLPYLWYVLGGTLFLGIILGLFLGGGGETVQPAPKCPLRHVPNPDIQSQIALCGRTSETNECVLYIMNTLRYDQAGETFFERAAKLTDRSSYLISVVNPVYSQLIVPPGHFAEIKIPAKK